MKSGRSFGAWVDTLPHHSSLLSFRSMTLPSERVSEAASIDAIVEMSMAASVPILLASSPAEPTLDGNDEMSAVETSVSSNVEWLEQPEGVEAITAWAVKPIPIAVRGHTRDSTHWLTYPEMGFHGSASARH